VFFTIIDEGDGMFNFRFFTSNRGSGKTITFVIIILVLIGANYFLLLPSGHPPRGLNTKKSCISHMRTCGAAALLWSMENSDKVGSIGWQDLVDKGYLKERNCCPNKGKYTIEVVAGTRPTFRVQCSHHKHQGESRCNQTPSYLVSDLK
jgi:hypothetical protein